MDGIGASSEHLAFSVSSAGFVRQKSPEQAQHTLTSLLSDTSDDFAFKYSEYD